MSEIKDALGRDIVIGDVYGYHRANNGFVHNTIGEAISVKNGRVKLKILDEYVAVYAGEVKIEKNTKVHTTVMANRVFNLGNFY